MPSNWQSGLIDMSKKISAILNSNKLLFISFGLSVAMVVLGILLIVFIPSETEPSAQKETAIESDLTKSLNDTESLINHASGTSANSVEDDAQIVRGSEEWCESMMLKPGSDWNDPDTQLFAEKCLYE